jgi:steroid 5-alpha reductase family enzyme
MIDAYLQGLLVMLSLAVITWIISVRKHDASIVDSIWSVFFLLGSVVYFISSSSYSVQQIVVLALVVIWALRLSIYITLRNHGKPEDSRYRDIRERYSPYFALKSLFIIFIFQALLAGFISMPLWYVFTHPADFDVVAALAVSLWFIGMFFEMVGDMQLANFKRSEASRNGGVLDHGLWRYSRHPNYFGEACIWWAYYLFAVSAGGWWTIPAPILMTWLLLKFSGVVLLEKDIVNRRPSYREYIKNTSAFIPWPPKKFDKSSANSEVAG